MRRQRAFGTITGWGMAAARAPALVVALVLALVLSLALVAPGAGLAADVAFHGGGAPTGLAAAAEPAPGGAQADPGIGCHLHCGCLLAVPLSVTAAPPRDRASRRLYARLAETGSSIEPDRLPRPPRA